MRARAPFALAHKYTRRERLRKQGQQLQARVVTLEAQAVGLESAAGGTHGTEEAAEAFRGLEVEVRRLRAEMDEVVPACGQMSDDIAKLSQLTARCGPWHGACMVDGVSMALVLHGCAVAESGMCRAVLCFVVRGVLWYIDSLDHDEALKAAAIQSQLDSIAYARHTLSPRK
jgi:hypothetical protein